MAFTISDFEDLVKLLGEHPEWQARLRPVILGEEILSIPSRMDRVEAVLESLAVRVDSLTEEVRNLTTAVRDLGLRADRSDGRLSNLEGSQLEYRYHRQLGSWFGTWLRRPQRLSADELEVFDAQASGTLSEQEVSRVQNADMLVSGSDRADLSATLLLAVEVSYTINPDDVERADEAARLLARLGHRARGFVGGYRVTEEAERLAQKLNVIVDLHRPAA